METDPIARRAADALRADMTIAPEVALVLGSGLGDLAAAAEGAVVVPTSQVEGMPASTVEGHRGRLIFGSLESVPVAFLQGRTHLYEGHGIGAVTFPIRLMHALGARRIILTNAAGGINARMGPGSLMLITDHIDMAGIRVPTGRGPSAAAVRAPHPYDEAWVEQVERIALESHIALQRGTYVWVRGPSYETKAEIRAFRRMGADAVGMSTVPEVLQAAALGMQVLGISTITNPAAGMTDGALSHADVLAVGQRVRLDLERLLRAILQSL